MSLWTLLLVYVIGGVTFIPILIVAAFAALLYLSPPVGDADPSKRSKGALNSTAAESEKEKLLQPATGSSPSKPLQGWVVVRRTFEEPPIDNASYVGNLMRSFLDSRQQSTSASSSTASAGNSSRRPRDTFYALLKGTVLYLYEDEACTECYAALQVAAYDVGIWPDPRTMTDAELFAKRNAIRLKAKESTTPPVGMNVVSKDMKLGEGGEKGTGSSSSREPSPAGRSLTDEHYMFVKCNSDMEDWYMALVHASTASASSSAPTSLLPDPLVPLEPIFSTDDMAHLVKTLDQQPDPIPMRWLNALVGRIFYSLYRTSGLEANLIARLMKKITKVPRPAFLTELVVREVNVGNTAPLLSKPMLKELTKEGDASVEMGLNYHSQEGEHSGIRITVEATVTINIKESLPLNLGNRFDFKPRVVKLVLAVILRSMEGNILVRIKRPPSNRIWWGFTSMPKMEIELLPIVSDRKIKWGLVLKPIESLLREVIQDSVVLPNMDDIPFFDTDQYAVRGGIFPDAVRTVYDFSSPSAAASTETTVTTEDGSQITTVSPTTVVPTSANLELKKEKPSTAEDDMGFAESMSLPGELKIIEEQEVPVGRTDTTLSAPVAGVVSSSPKRSWFPRFGGASATRPTPSAPSPQPTIMETPPPEKEEDVKELSATETPGPKPDTPTPKPEAETTLPPEQPSPPASKVEVKDDESVPDTAADTKETAKEEAPIEAPTPAPVTDEKPSSSTDALVPPTTPIPIRKRSPTLTHQSSRSAAGDFFSPPKSSLVANGQSSPSPLAKAEVPKEDTTVTMAGITPTTSTQPAPAPRGILDALRAQTADSVSSESSTAPTTNNRSSATQTLITAWKNREANKQVLAATARETMKKWGFNLKKDAAAAEPAQSANGSAAGQAGTDGSSTAGSTRPATPESRNKTYEQMRAEAAERRHRDPSPQPDTGEFGERARTISSNGALNASPYRPPSPKPTTQLNTLSRAPTSPNGQQLRPDPAAFLSAEQPLDAEERMRRMSSGSGPHPGPVMRQPGQAAMMRIPGIHASHKGDVMAIGSSPPLPPSIPEDSGEGPLVAKTLGPKTAAAVQTMYRLFQKNNAPAGTEGSTTTLADSHSDQTPNAPASTSNPKPEVGDVHEPEPHPEVDHPTDTSPPAASPIRATGTPPPLPPRHTPSPTHEKHDSVSSASSFLKQIQAKDATRSGSVGGSKPSSRRTSLMEPQKGGPDDPFTAAPSESNVVTPASTEVAS
ncbi:hypothetical protein FS837_009269 [Tulasnella sp. UAMH 9824]|nr:hypothetical protein FS837_009269 [Tulasnella sp. UAMH 9824]